MTNTVNIPEKLSTPPHISNLGPIPNPEEFSKKCPEIFGGKGFDIELEKTDDGFDLSDIPEQFRPAVEFAIREHFKTATNQTNCVVRLNQGTLEKGNFRVIAPHIDALVEKYPDNTYPENDIFIVSDALTTLFYEQAFDLPQQSFAKPEDLNWTLSERLQAQVDETKCYAPKPYEMMRYDSYAVHAARNATQRTDRTFLMVQFY